MIFQPHKSLLRGKKLLFNTGELGAIVEVLVITLFDEEYRGPSRFCNAISKSHLFGFCVGHRRAHGFLDDAILRSSVSRSRSGERNRNTRRRYIPSSQKPNETCEAARSAASTGVTCGRPSSCARRLRPHVSHRGSTPNRFQDFPGPCFRAQPFCDHCFPFGLHGTNCFSNASRV